MATVVITFFLLTRFYVCKMDADCIDRRRDRILSRREKRWSMNSQRLEEIVAELMKPISDVRRSFDTDLSALLEEYLTEAGLHALEAGEDEDAEAEAGAGMAAPNFAELALLLQHSASVYGRKVDFLYQHVLSVSDSLQQSTQEIERSSNEVETEASPSGRKRRRASCAGAGGAGGGGGFSALTLQACGGALREAGRTRPPPTLPRAYLELEPRALGAADLPLTDYDAEPVGLLADFHVSWRLQDGMLVDELESWGQSGGSLRPIPLMELQAAIEAAAPPALPPPPPDLEPPPSRDHTPPRDMSPLPLHASTPLPLPPPEPLVKRKRKCDVSTDDLVGGCFKIICNKELQRKFRKLEEFSLDGAWVSGVVAARRDHVRAHRRRLRLRSCDLHFRGFDESDLDIGGFAGWSSGEAATAAEAMTGLANVTAGAGVAGACEGESDDDGFFEQSSLGDSDASRVDDSTLISPTALTALDNSAWSSWQAGVVARAAAGEARGLDIRELAERVISHLPPGPGPAPGPESAPGTAPAPAPAPAAHCSALLREAARDAHDVPALFLATLFLANSGNVEVIQGPPLTLNSFSLRLLSPDARLYAAVARGDPHFLR